MVDDELIARAQAYEADAVGEIYRRYADAIYRYIYYRVGEAAVAEDLLGDVFVGALEQLPSFRNVGKPFEAWLFSIAHNKVVDHYRRQNVRRASPLNEEMVDTRSEELHQLVAQRDDMQRAWGAVARLTEEQQQVVALRFLFEYSIAEVAAQLGKTEGAIKALQSRALATLRRYLGDDRG